MTDAPADADARMSQSHQAETSQTIFLEGAKPAKNVSWIFRSLSLPSHSSALCSKTASNSISYHLISLPAASPYHVCSAPYFDGGYDLEWYVPRRVLVLVVDPIPGLSLYQIFLLIFFCFICSQPDVDACIASWYSGHPQGIFHELCWNLYHPHHSSRIHV